MILSARRFLTAASVVGFVVAVASWTGCATILGITDLSPELEAGAEGEAEASTLGGGEDAAVDAVVSGSPDRNGEATAIDGGDTGGFVSKGGDAVVGVPDSDTTEEAAPRDGGDAAMAADGSGCAATELLCGTACLPNDARNCGACGHDCTNLPHVSGPVTCLASGACSFVLSSCATGWTHCAANADVGCESDLSTTSNCGGCGAACSGATPVCSGSGAGGTYSCVSGCPASMPTLCGGSCTDTMSSASHCGACANACATGVAHAQPECANGACTFTCNSGYSPCSGTCVNEQSDSSNCGGCGVTCNGGTPVCLNGACAACTPGATRCSGTVPQSCDTGGVWQSGPVTVGQCGAICMPSAAQCAGNGVQTCGSNGLWGSAVACAGTSPMCSNAACISPPSCRAGGAGLTDCGAASESCCTSLNVTGGTFNRTYSNGGSGPTGEADPATVTGFRLDKYLVTVGRFRQFFNAYNGGWTPPAGSGKHTHLNGGNGLNATGGGYESGWMTSDNSNLAPTNANLACDTSYSTWTVSPGTNEQLPVTCMNWWESYAFCIWDGGFLPSQAELEYAAAAGSAEREYPWGSAAPGTGNQYAIYDCYYPTGSGTCSSVMNIAPVGTATLGAGAWGQLDLAGEVWEWTLDWLASDGKFINPCTDCACLTAGSSRYSSGGTFNSGSPELQSFLLAAGDPMVRNRAGGLRCARAP